MTTIEIIITMILMIAAVICIFGLAAAFTSKSNIKRDKPPLIPTPSQKNNIRRVYQYPGKEDIYVFWLLTKSIEFAYEELESSLKEYIEQYDLVLDVNKYELEETAQLDKNVDDILKIDSDKKGKTGKNTMKMTKEELKTLLNQNKQQNENIVKPKQTTKVTISGMNNDVTIYKKEGQYIKNIKISGMNRDATYYTDADIKIDMSGMNNDLEIDSNLNVISEDNSGTNNDVTRV